MGSETVYNTVNKSPDQTNSNHAASQPNSLTVHQDRTSNSHQIQVRRPQIQQSQNLPFCSVTVSTALLRNVAEGGSDNIRSFCHATQ